MSFQQKEFGMYFSPRPDSNGTTKSIVNDQGEVEYDMYEPPSASRPYSMSVEYVLPDPKNSQHELNAATKNKKPIIQDIYDEDHYCYARPVEDSSTTLGPVANKEDEKKDTNTPVRGHGRCSLKTKKIIICVFCCFLVVCVIGGVATYLTLSKKGKF